MSKRYRVKCEPEWDYIFIEVEAENEEEAKELAEEKFSNGEWEDDREHDFTQQDLVTAIEAEEIEP